MEKYRKSVFVVTYAIEGNKVYYLVLKRQKHWVGWEFPKGGIEKSESLVNTVKREVKEEVGADVLKIKKFNFSGKYRYKKSYSDRPGFFGQSYSLYSAKIKKGKIKVDKIEHTDYKWLSFDKAYRREEK